MKKDKLIFFRTHNPLGWILYFFTYFLVKQKIKWSLGVDDKFFDTGETLRQMSRDKELTKQVYDILKAQAPKEFKALNSPTLEFDKLNKKVIINFLVY
jgi:predicted NAD-dependent protein-ADP-ribosyltransferase YbiA (DUF1768 family)